MLRSHLSHRCPCQPAQNSARGANLVSKQYKTRPTRPPVDAFQSSTKLDRLDPPWMHFKAVQNWSCSTRHARIKAAPNSFDPSQHGLDSKQYKTLPTRCAMHTFQSSTKLVLLDTPCIRFKVVQTSFRSNTRANVSKQYKTRWTCSTVDLFQSSTKLVQTLPPSCRWVSK